MRQFMERYDLLVTPAVAVPAFDAKPAGHQTLTPETMRAFDDHGKSARTVDEGVDEAREAFRRAGEAALLLADAGTFCFLCCQRWLQVLCILLLLLCRGSHLERSVVVLHVIMHV